ncbi:hypothetical protein AB3M93_08800 [Novosphingobium panipatense]|jgi:hypothetical protein|uniref:hypothetical protein n=1 Tax=Novosphingobium TaxID=165696 RepID=UPI000CDAC17A|nr:hypothetical protein [Novosphingobium sp. HII-3]
MTEKSADRIDEATTRILDLEAELEASGTMTREAAALARARTLLHEWVDSVTAVVATPGVGRVVLIHENGAESRIASPELPFRLAIPVTFGGGNETAD